MTLTHVIGARSDNSVLYVNLWSASWVAYKFHKEKNSEIRGEYLPQNLNCDFNIYYTNKTETPKGQSEEAQTSFVHEQK